MAVSARQKADPATPARTAEPTSRLASAGGCKAKKPAAARAEATRAASDVGELRCAAATSGIEPKDATCCVQADAHPKGTIMASSPALAAAHQITPARPPGATLRTTTVDTMISAHRRFGATRASVAATATSKPASAVNAAVAHAAIPATTAAGEPEKRVATTSFGDVAPKRRSRGPKPIAASATPMATPSGGGSDNDARPGSRQTAIPATTAAKPSPPYNGGALRRAARNEARSALRAPKPKLARPSSVRIGAIAPTSLAGTPIRSSPTRVARPMANRTAAEIANTLIRLRESGGDIGSLSGRSRLLSGFRLRGQSGSQLRLIRSLNVERADRRSAGQIPPSQTKAGPSQTKEIGSDFLGFLRPIRGFSMGYEESKEKTPLPTSGCRLIRSSPPAVSAPLPASRSCFILDRCNTGIENHQGNVEVLALT